MRELGKEGSAGRMGAVARTGLVMHAAHGWRLQKERERERERERATDLMARESWWKAWATAISLAPSQEREERTVRTSRRRGAAQLNGQ